MKTSTKDRLVNEALADNFNLRASLKRIREWLPFTFIAGLLTATLGILLASQAFV